MAMTMPGLHTRQAANVRIKSTATTGSERKDLRRGKYLDAGKTLAIIVNTRTNVGWVNNVSTAESQHARSASLRQIPRNESLCQ